MTNAEAIEWVNFAIWLLDYSITIGAFLWPGLLAARLIRKMLL